MFINNQNMTAEFENPYILVCDKEISEVNDILPVIANIAQGNVPVLIIAEDVNGEALTTLIENNMPDAKGYRRFRCAVVRTPGHGEERREYLEDIAIVTGATFISSDRGMDLSNFENKLTFFTPDKGERREQALFLGIDFLTPIAKRKEKLAELSLQALRTELCRRISGYQLYEENRKTHFGKSAFNSKCDIKFVQAANETTANAETLGEDE